MNKKDNFSRTGLEIAVIGMAGRFPGAKDVSQFWDNLLKGRETISFFPDQALEESGTDAGSLKNPNYIKAKGIIEDLEYFDELFFNFTPIEGQVIDPQIRNFMEISSEALQLAGYDSTNFKGRIGVYAGANINLYWSILMIYSNTEFQGFLKRIFGYKDYISTLTSYKLDLRGPSVSLFSACSTSMVAIDMACRALLTGECEMALAGGVSMRLPKKEGYFYHDGMLLSRDGHCRTFDAHASGTVFGHGTGVVLLKPLEQAIEDGDYIYAVIKGTASNNDGIGKVGFTAPTVEGQASVIRSALHLAEVDPESIGYLEAHGTATVLGDPIEVEAMTRAFNSDKRGFCRIGSVKTNVGHLDCAAGVTGFIKAVLTLKNRIIPPSLHYEAPNPKIDFENSPFIVNNSLFEWKSNDQYPLRAAVNSLGVGGTNAYAILEEAPPVPPGSEGRKWKLILFSAKTETALDKISEDFVEHLKNNPDINLADAAYTLQVGRKPLEHKKMLVCSSVREAIDTLTSEESKKIHRFYSKETDRPVIFLFSGQGSQYVNMGLDLYRTEHVFREELQRCFSILEPIMGYHLQEIVYPSQEQEEQEGNVSANRERINQTEITQPVLFAFEYALAKLLMSWGISPLAMIGHSIGEYVAACLSGVFSLEDALELVAFRGKSMQELAGGAMLSVSLSESELTPLLKLKEEISLAAVNSPALCTVSGTHEAIDDFARLLEEKEIKYRKLHTSHAFHSNMMDPILDKFSGKVQGVSLSRPQVPYISNVSGNWIDIETAADAGYWARHLRGTVRFADGLTELLKEDNAIFIEVGPGRSLSTFVTLHPGKKNTHSIVNVVRHPTEEAADDYYLLNQLGKIWTYGKKIDWSGYYCTERRLRLPLPTYPFEKTRLWIEGNPFTMVRDLVTSGLDLRRITEVSDLFSIPSWKSAPLPVLAEKFEFSCYLLFADELGLSAGLVERLEMAGHDVIVVKKGAAFCVNNVQEYTINPGNGEDYQALFDELRRHSRLPRFIVHLWSVTHHRGDASDLEFEVVEELQSLGYYSLLYMMQALGKFDYKAEIGITVVSNNMQEVFGQDGVCPGKATVLGPVKVIPKEYPNMSCRSVDVIMPITGVGEREREREMEKLIEQLYMEITSKCEDEIVAYRNQIRMTQSFEPFHWEKSEESPRLKEGGVYLITGGTGGIGLVLAEYIAAQVSARFVLVGRSSLPAHEEWEEWLNSHDEEDPVSEKLRKILELEQKGAEVMVVGANISDEGQMGEVISQACQRFGGIDGVIHSAGIADLGGMIQRRTRESSQGVFEPKIKGSIVLNRVLKDMELDFFVQCSSVIAILGPFGEAAYTAANSFLDAFTYHRNKYTNSFTLTINWDLWVEVGMAVNLMKKTTAAKNLPAQVKKVQHPLWEECCSGKAGEKIYTTTFVVDKYWVLNEHKIMHNPVLVGTAYLEMARAAFQDYTQCDRVEIREVYFLNPLVVSENKGMEFRMVLKEREGYFEFYFMSRPEGGKGKWKPHARGELEAMREEPPVKHNIEELRALCNKRTQVFSVEDYKAFEGFVGTSQRWNSRKRSFLGNQEELCELELLDEYKDDIGIYWLHPAFLDTCLAFINLLYLKLEGSSENYLPFSYKKLRVKGPLPQKVFSYGKFLGFDSSEKKTIKFDIKIMDEQGVEVVEIEEFTLLNVSEKGTPIANAARDAYPISFFLGDENETRGGAQANKPEGLSSYQNVPGLLCAEGVECFHRILGGRFPQVAVSTQNIGSRLYMMKNPPVQEKEVSSKARDSRPALKTEYIAPRNETEEILASIFTKHLGIDQIGVHDDFFELGLESVKAVDLVGKIKSQLKVDIQVADIFNFPTIAEIAKLGNSDSNSDSKSDSDSKEQEPESELVAVGAAVNETIAYENQG